MTLLALVLSGLLTAQPSALPQSPLPSDPPVETSQSRYEEANRSLKASYFYATSVLASQAGNYEEAAGFLQKAAESDPKSERLQEDLAENYQNLGRLGEALDALKRAAELDPGNLDLKMKMAGIRIEQDKAGEARDLYQQVLEREPGNLEALRQLGSLEMSVAHFQAALGLLQRAVAAQPDSVPARMELAQCYSRLGKSAEAVREFQQVIQEEPDYLNAYFQMGLLQETEGNADKAILAYQQGLEHDSENLALLSALAHAYYRQERYAEAEAQFSHYLEGQAGGGPEDRLTLALCRLQQSKWPQAERDFKAISATSQAMEAARLYGMGMAQAGQKEYDQAETSFKLLMQKDPNAVPAYSQLAFIYAATSRTAKAMDVIQKGIQQNPKADELYVLASGQYLDAKEYGKSRGILQQGLQNAGDSAGLHFQMAVTLDKSGDFQGAEKELQSVLQIDPKHGEALNYLGYSWVDRGVKLKQAVGLIKRALAVEPENPYFQDSLAWAYFKQHKFRLAANLLEKAVQGLNGRASQDDAVVYDHLSEVYRKLGKDGDARAQSRKAQDLRAQQ